MAAANGNLSSALRYLDAHHDDWKRTLVELSRIPSVSAEGFPPAEVRRSATAVADEWSESTATPPEELPGAAVAESTESIVQSAEEVATEAEPEVAPAPRRTRSTSRGRRGAAPKGEATNGSAGGETPT